MQLVLIASLIGFLLVSLVLGFIAGKKTKTLSDFISGNKRWSTGAIVMTYIATVFGGRTLINESFESYNYGIFPTLAFVGISIGLFIGGRLFARAFSNFQDCETLADVIQRLYGNKTKIFASVLSVVLCVTLAGLQIKCLTTIVSIFIDFAPSYNVLLCGSIVTLYTLYGGMRAVVATDIFQFFLIFGAIALIASFAIEKAGGLYVVMSNWSGIKNVETDFSKFENLQFYIGLFISGLFSSLLAYPHNMKRILLNRGSIQLKKSMSYIGIFHLIGVVILGFISMSAIILTPTAKSGVEIFKYLSHETVPSAFQPLVFVGLVALVFSTGDSIIHAGGVILCKNLLTDFGLKESLRTARYSVLLIGLLATILALKGSWIFSKLAYLQSIVVPSLSIPVFMGLCGYKTSTRGFWAAAICSNVMYYLVQLTMPSISGFAILFALLTNLCIFFASKFIEEGEFFKSFVTKTYTRLNKF